MKTIVVGTDGSASSLVAVRQAAELASATGAQLHIAIAVGLSSGAVSMSAMGSGLPGNWYEVAQADAACAITKAADVARANGACSEGQVLQGEPAAALMNLCDEIGADLLVVGSRGMSGAARFLLGSVPNRCAHHAACSVMVVRTT
jgi:nucleotide-binding universal stress UspA family protein